MELSLPNARGARDSLVVDQKHLAALSSNEAHGVVPICHMGHYNVKHWGRRQESRVHGGWHSVPAARRVSSPMAIDPKFIRAEELGIRLEIVAGLPIWEAAPALRHQKAVDRIRSSIRAKPGASCACVHIADVYVAFPDGSLKRPDISIFCREPSELDEAITLVPEAVIEVVSKGYEAKDLTIGPAFYLSQGVKDVVVFDPTTLAIIHARRDATRRLLSEIDIELECGCSCRV
jgi:Uma2 family endonuclease